MVITEIQADYRNAEAVAKVACTRLATSLYCHVRVVTQGKCDLSLLFPLALSTELMTGLAEALGQEVLPLLKQLVEELEHS